MPMRVATIGFMAKKRSDDRHSGETKPMQLRIHPLLRQQLEILAERNLTTMTAEVVAALRKHLTENGLWPPPEPPAPEPTKPARRKPKGGADE